MFIRLLLTHFGKHLDISTVIPILKAKLPPSYPKQQPRLRRVESRLPLASRPSTFRVEVYLSGITMYDDVLTRGLILDCG